MAFTKVATVTEVPPNAGKQVQIGDKAIALFNCDGTFYAIEDTCPHAGASLAEGDLEGTEVYCPWHSARFDVTTGQHLCPPAPCGVPGVQGAAGG